MAKPKPDQIIRHEIVLGQTERNQLKEITNAYQFNRISQPILTALGDPAFLLLSGGLLLFFLDDLLRKIGINPEDLPEMEGSDLEDWLEAQNLAYAGVGGVLGFLLFGGTGAIAGAILGSVSAEVGEANPFSPLGVWDYTQDNPPEEVARKTTASLIGFRRRLERALAAAEFGGGAIA